MFWYIILLGIVLLGGWLFTNNDDLRIQIVGLIMVIITSAIIMFYNPEGDEQPKEEIEHITLKENYQTVDTIFVVYKNGNIVGSFIKK